MMVAASSVPSRYLRTQTLPQNHLRALPPLIRHLHRRPPIPIRDDWIQAEFYLIGVL